jgi:hypothetical protein
MANTRSLVRPRGRGQRLVGLTLEQRLVAEADMRFDDFDPT